MDTASHDTLSTPFRLQDVTFIIGEAAYNGTSIALGAIDSAGWSTLTFSNQKNAVRGEKIGHSRSGHSRLCPVKLLGKRILHLRQHNAPPETPLYTVYTPNGNRTVTSTLITQNLRHSAAAVQHQTNVSPITISARSLRAASAMALLCAKVDKNHIQLVGRWKSDAMIRYLHAQAVPILENLSQRMVQHGQFTFLPTDPFIPVEAAPLLNEHPH
jgi:hypothetical protein